MICFSRTPITNKDTILNDITKTWDESPEKIKELYPEGYMERYKRGTLKFLSLSISDKPQEVVNCMEEAIVAYDPKYVYNPGTYFARLSYWLLCRLPKPVADLLVYDQCAVK